MIMAFIITVIIFLFYLAWSLGEISELKWKLNEAKSDLSRALKSTSIPRQQSLQNPQTLQSQPLSHALQHFL
jgi:hypothetical protein